MTPPRRLLPLAVLAALPLAAACSLSRPSPLEALNAQPPQAYRGHYTSGSGESWFRPCNAAPADSAWWVTLTDAAVSQADSARRAGLLVEGRPSYVQWRAVPTRGGEVGPRGPGAPALLVRAIDVVRPAGTADCAAP